MSLTLRVSSVGSDASALVDSCVAISRSTSKEFAFERDLPSNDEELSLWSARSGLAEVASELSFPASTQSRSFVAPR